MALITVIGGSGFAGSNIVREAAKRGHAVTSVSRSLPAEKVSGVTYIAADILDPAVVRQVVDDAEVVVSALSPRGDMVGKVPGAVRALALAAQAKGKRLGVVGGAGSLQVAKGGPLLADTPDFHEAFKPEAREMIEVLADLRGSDETLDWFLVSPAAVFGAYAAGERTGEYRVGGDEVLTDENGESTISGADFAIAVVDEIDNPAHHRARFTVAY